MLSHILVRLVSSQFRYATTYVNIATSTFAVGNLIQLLQ